MPVLDFTRIRNSNVINITIVDSSINQSSMIEQKPFDDLDDEDEDGNKKTEKPSEKQPFLLIDENIEAEADTHKTPVKFHNPQYLDDPNNQTNIILGGANTDNALAHEHSNKVLDHYNIPTNANSSQNNSDIKVKKPHISQKSIDFMPRPPQGPGPRRSM